MAHQPPGNAQVLSKAKFRRFDGIGGPRTQIIRRKDSKGYDVSHAMANEIIDFQLTERGSLIMRSGCRKITTSGFDDTVHTLIDIQIGLISRYGVHHGTQLDIIDRPMWVEFPSDPVFLSPASAQGIRSDERVPVFPGDPL